MAYGVPSDRVLGVPVAVAMHPLPDTCCAQHCGGEKGRYMGLATITLAKRRMCFRASLLLAMTVLALSTIADALASKLALWQAAQFYGDKVRS